mgnify:FL=1
MGGNKITLTNQILIAMLAGIGVGICFNMLGPRAGIVENFLFGGLFLVIGSIFIASLKMMVVPLVFVSLVCGVTSMGDLRALGRIGSKSVGYYIFTTAIAISIALLIAVVISPGAGFTISSSAIEYQAATPPNLSQVFIDLIPSNPIAALGSGKMLQIIVFLSLIHI